MTVSRVLRNESNVAEVTEQRVQAIADRLGYKPNRLVRGMPHRQQPLGSCHTTPATAHSLAAGSRKPEPRRIS